MKRLLILTGLIWILIAILGSLVIVYGRTQRIPPLLEGLATCGGVTCYQGITPGHTPWSEVVTTWGDRSSTLVNINYGSMVIDFGTPIQVHLMQSRDLQRVIFVQIQLDHATPFTLGMTLMRYGNPCAITLSSGVLMMRYSDFIIDIDAMQPGPLMPRTRISGIFLNGNNDLCHIRYTKLQSAWHGFATYFGATH